MQSLNALLADYQPSHLQFDIPIQGLAIDSRTIKPGEVFLAYPGIKTDGREYISQAIAAGAAAILYEPLNFTPPQVSIPCIPIAHLKNHLGAIAARWYGNPTQHLNVIGITGTNGKTSCSHFLAHCLSQLDMPCGILGTLGVGFAKELKESGFTTPQVLDVHHYAADLLSAGAKALAMEVSSHALTQGRVNNVHFNSAIFTNLTQDHLDYHTSMAAYGAAKAQLFHWPSLQHAILNLDDAFAYGLYVELKQQSHLSVVGYSTKAATLGLGGQIIRATDLQSDMQGIRAKIITPWGEGKLQSRLVGHFHIHNLLAVLSSLASQFLSQNLFSLAELLSVLETIEAVPGRMEYFGGGHKPLVLVDYAHTPDALLNVLQSLRSYHPHKLWCVMGCGGDRDNSKRAVMGKIAAMHSDELIITNDNPRTESPEKIIADITADIQKTSIFKIEYDRAAAIIMAISQAKPGDIVLVAGKGHENYQIIGEHKYYFSDAEEVKKALEL